METTTDFPFVMFSRDGSNKIFVFRDDAGDKFYFTPLAGWRRWADASRRRQDRQQWRYLSAIVEVPYSGGRGPRDRGCHRLGRHRGHAKIRSRSSDVLARDGLALGSKIVPAFLQNLPVVLVVGAPKNHGPHFDARISAPVSPALMSRSSFCDHRLPYRRDRYGQFAARRRPDSIGDGELTARQTPNAIHASSACFVASNDFLS